MVLSAKVNKGEKQKVVSLAVPQKPVKRRKLKLRLGGPTVVLFILLGFIFYSFGGQIVEMYKVRHEISKIQEQMDDLKTKNTELRRQLEQLNSDAYIEREAREKLGLVKPGEKIILEAHAGQTVTPSNPEKRQNAEVH